MMGYYGNYSNGFGFFGLLLVILFWILVIWGVIMLIRWLTCPGGNCRHMYHMGGMHHRMDMGMRDDRDGGDSAMKILKERYAKGEISKEEYEERMKVLMS